MLTTSNLSVIPQITTLVLLSIVTEPGATMSLVVTELGKEEMQIYMISEEEIRLW